MMKKIVKSMVRISILLTISIFLLGVLPRILGGGFHKIVGSSMFPTFTSGDVVLVYNAKKELERDDLVEVRHDGILLIKRLIGLPGDEIILKDGCVFRNRKLCPEYYIFNNPTYPVPMLFKLEEDEYFILGDNRDVSYDSRYFGPVHRKDIKMAYGLFFRLWREDS